MKILKTYDEFIIENLKTVDDIEKDRNINNFKCSYICKKN